MPSQTGSIDLKAISVASSDATTKASNAAKTATNYITADSTGIKIASSDPSQATTYQHQTATNTEYYINSEKLADIGGNGIILGKTTTAPYSHLELTGSSMKFRQPSYVNIPSDFEFNANSIYPPDPFNPGPSGTHNGWIIGPKTKLNRDFVQITPTSFSAGDPSRSRDDNATLLAGIDTVRIGKASTSNIKLDYHSLKLIDRNENTYFHVSDLRNENGVYSYEETVDYDISQYVDPDSGVILGVGNQVTSFVFPFVVDSFTVTLDDVDDTDHWSVSEHSSTGEFTSTWIDRDEALVSGVCVFTGQSSSDNLKVLTFGSRKSDSIFNTVGEGSAVIGYDCSAMSRFSYAEGYGSVSRGLVSHAEGYNTTAYERASHAEGESTTAYNNWTHAEGYGSVALGKYSHAQNLETYANGTAQTVIGKYNKRDSNKAFIIGNGSETALSNAFTIDWDGNTWLAGGTTLNGDLDIYGSSSQKANVPGDAPSENEYHGSIQSFDSTGDRDFYSMTAHTPTDVLYRSFVLKRDINNTSVLNGFYLRINDDGTKEVTFTTGAASAWRTGLGLGSLATENSLAASDIPSLAASKINSGTFDAARIPDSMSASKITSTSPTSVTLNSATKAYSSGMTPKYRKWGNVVNVYGAVSPKSEVAAGGSLTIGSLPSGYRPAIDSVWLCQGSGNAVWTLTIDSDGTMRASRYRNGASVNAAIPTNAWLIFNVTYIVS